MEDGLFIGADIDTYTILNAEDFLTFQNDNSKPVKNEPDTNEDPKTDLDVNIKPDKAEDTKPDLKVNIEPELNVVGKPDLNRNVKPDSNEEESSFKCRRCKLPFEKIESLDLHEDVCVVKSVELKEDDRKYKYEKFNYVKCRNCKLLLHRSIVEKHQCKEETSVTYVCELCKAEFKEPSGLSKHSKICSNSKKGVSLVVDLKINREEEYVKTSQNIKCELCKAEFQQEQALSKHSMVCSKNTQVVNLNVPKVKWLRQRRVEEFKCRYCRTIFFDGKDFLSHLENCKMKTNEFKCKLCNKNFLQNQKLLDHIKKCKNFMIKCKFCNQSFNSSFVNRHMQSEYHKRNSSGSINCQSCNGTFKDIIGLQMHVKICNSRNPIAIGEINSQQKFICNFCNVSFITNNALEHHKLGSCVVKKSYDLAYENLKVIELQDSSLDTLWKINDNHMKFNKKILKPEDILKTAIPWQNFINHKKMYKKKGSKNAEKSLTCQTCNETFQFRHRYEFHISNCQLH